MNIPGDRGYGKIHGNPEKKMGTKSGEMNMGKFTEKYAKSTNVQSKG